MGWHQQQCSYNIITPRAEHKAHQSIGATSTRIAGQSAQSSPALWKANKAASSNKPESLNSARPNGFDMLKAKTQTRTIAAHGTRRCWICLCAYFFIKLDTFCPHKLTGRQWETFLDDKMDLKSTNSLYCLLLKLCLENERQRWNKAKWGEKMLDVRRSVGGSEGVRNHIWGHEK